MKNLTNNYKNFDTTKKCKMKNNSNQRKNTNSSKK